MSTTQRLADPPRLGPRYLLALLPGRGGRTLPEQVLTLDGLTSDPGKLARYAQVCGFPVDGRLPLTYPQVLAFGMQVQLMTSPGFPLRLPGLVHLRQRITLHRQLGAGEPLDLRVHAADLREHPRGTQVDLHAAVSVRGEPVWSGISTYLSRVSSGGASGSGEDSAERDPWSPAPDNSTLAARWRLPSDTGRRYAAVSGDVNPIHLNPVAARLFGFPGAIAHGMWTAARCLATLQGRLPDRYCVDVTFGKPVVLPTTVELHTARLRGSWHLALLGARDRIHLRATIT